jgi:tetratricopeptide (TPR) repeat protein
MGRINIEISVLLLSLFFSLGALLFVFPSAQAESGLTDPQMLDKAFSCNKYGDNKLAIKYFNLYLKQHPNDLVALRGRADILYRTKQYQKSIEDYSRAIALDPNDKSTYEGRAGSYFALHRYDKSIADITKQIELAPNRYMGYLSRANVEAKAGLTKAAIDDCTKSIEVKPTHAALYLRGQMYRKLGLQEKADKDLKDSFSAPNAYQPGDD